MRTLVLFQVGNSHFGLDMPLTRSIQSASAFLAEQSGNIRQDKLVLDGVEIPVYDLTTIMGEATSLHDPGSRKVVIVKNQAHHLALVVDRVDQVVEVERDLIEPLPPIFKGPALECFPWVLRQQDNLVPILRPEGISKIIRHNMDTQKESSRREV